MLSVYERDDTSNTMSPDDWDLYVDARFALIEEIEQGQQTMSSDRSEKLATISVTINESHQKHR